MILVENQPWHLVIDDSGWLGGVVVGASDSRLTDHEFDSRQPHCRVATVMGKS